MDFLEVIPLGASPKRVVEGPHALGGLLTTLEACARIELARDQILGVLLSW